MERWLVGTLLGAVGAVVASIGGGAYFWLRSTAAPSRTAVAVAFHSPRHLWRSVRGKHWQIISSEFEEPEATDAREGTRGSCRAGMVAVKGNMLQEPDDNPHSEGRIDFMQRQICSEWIRKEYPERCGKFDREKWLAMSAGLHRKPMHFCIDRFEYPNVKGQYPMVFMSWYEAKELCEDEGKRLCTEDEWTFACEGEEARPYPYGDGYTRDPRKCVTDQPWTPYSETAMSPRDSETAGIEMDRLWRGKPSGQTECRSPFGVYDLTGNIDEWTTSVRQRERPSILKGGYWGPVRTRCRPSTRSHDQDHTFYQQGARCCTDAAVPQVEHQGGEARRPLERELE
jgi:hypothetical protein